MDVHEFKLVYNGKELGLFHRLCDYNIKKESTIHLAQAKFTEVFLFKTLVLKTQNKNYKLIGSEGPCRRSTRSKEEERGLHRLHPESR